MLNRGFTIGWACDGCEPEPARGKMWSHGGQITKLSWQNVQKDSPVMVIRIRRSLVHVFCMCIGDGSFLLVVRYLMSMTLRDKGWAVKLAPKL